MMEGSVLPWMISVISGTEQIVGWGEVASALVVISTAWLLIPKGYNGMRQWKQKRVDARVAEATMVAEKVVNKAITDMMTKLMSPNGGKSLWDIGVKLDQVIADNNELKIIQKLSDIRQERLERHVFDVMTPTQRDIAESVGVDSRIHHITSDQG